MLAHCEKDSAKVLQPRSIKLKQRHGGSPGWGETEDQGCVIAPDEMIVPVIGSRVKQVKTTFPVKESGPTVR